MEVIPSTSRVGTEYLKPIKRLSSWGMETSRDTRLFGREWPSGGTSLSPRVTRSTVVVGNGDRMGKTAQERENIAKVRCLRPCRKHQAHVGFAPRPDEQAFRHREMPIHGHESFNRLTVGMIRPIRCTRPGYWSASMIASSSSADVSQ